MPSVINIEVDDTGDQYVCGWVNIPSIGKHTFTLNVTLTQANFDKERERKDFARRHAWHGFNGGRRRTRRKRHRKRHRPRPWSPTHKLLKKVNRVEWLIFGKEYCPYCVKAKKFAKKKKLNYDYIDMNTMDDNEINILYRLVTTRPITIPIIFRLVDDKYKYIGGFSEIKQFKKNKF